MSQWSEKIPKENLSKTVSPTRYLFTSFNETWLQINNFRKSSKKFIIDLLTKNIALNLSGAIFFVGLGYSLKWWYKDQLFVVLLKQNLPALSESQQNLHWICEADGKSILNDEYQTWTPLIDRIDLDANHIRIKFKQPWQKPFYEQFIGVFGEPAQVNISKQILRIPFTGEKDWWKENSSVNKFSTYTLYTQKKPIFPKKLFKLSPHNLDFLNKISPKSSIPSTTFYPFRVQQKALLPFQGIGYKGTGVLKEFLINTKQKSFFSKANSFGVPASPRQLSPFGAPPASARVLQNLPGMIATHSGVPHASATPSEISRALTRVNWGSWRSKSAKQKDFSRSFTSTDKFSYPLQLTKKVAGWQPFPNLLLLNSYLDEIPSKLESALQSYFPRKNSQLLFLSTSFKKSINSRNKSLIYTVVNNSCNSRFSQRNIFNNVVIKSNSVNTLLCKVSPPVLHAFTQKVFTHDLPLPNVFDFAYSLQIEDLHGVTKYDKSKICTICNNWQNKEGFLPDALLWDQEQKSQALTEVFLSHKDNLLSSQEELPSQKAPRVWSREIFPQQEKLVIEELEAEGAGVKAHRGLLYKSKNRWVSDASANYKSSETENNKTEKTLDLPKEMFLVPGKQNEQSETYLKKLHLFKTKKLLQNQLTSLINSFPIDLVEKSKVSKDNKYAPSNFLATSVSNKSNLFEINSELLDVAKKILEVKRNALKKAIDPGVKGQYLPGLLYKSLMCNSWQSKEGTPNYVLPSAKLCFAKGTAESPLYPRRVKRSWEFLTRFVKNGDWSCVREENSPLRFTLSGYSRKPQLGVMLTNCVNELNRTKESVTEGYWETEVSRLAQLFAYSTVANVGDAKGVNPLLLLNTLGFTFNTLSPLTNPPILLSSENKINVVDKNINFDKNSRYMSGYIYPDIESNSLKAVLYPWLGKNKNLMSSHSHYLNDKPIALYSKNLKSNYNHYDNSIPFTLTGYKGVRSWGVQQHKDNLLLSHEDNLLLSQEELCRSREILLQQENQRYAKRKYNVYPIQSKALQGRAFSLIGTTLVQVGEASKGLRLSNIERNDLLGNSHYLDNIEIPYKKFNHYLAKFPGFSDPTQFFTTLPQIACGNESVVNESGELEKISTSNIVDKSEINKKFIQKNGCNSRKVAYSGIVVRRNKKTKDFQPFKDPRFVKKCKELNFGTNRKFVIADTSKSSIWGTLFLGSDNPLTNRQCHFFGQKQLSTLDTKSLQGDYLRELGKEILTQSNSKGYTEFLPLRGTSIERTKILSLSKKVNSFFFKKRKYSYLLEPKDQWHLLFQEQLCSALEDCKKYPLSTIHSFEETNTAKLDSGRIKVSAPLIMARFPKKLVQFRSIDDILPGYTSHQLEQGISWRPFCHLQRSFIYTPLKDNSLTQLFTNLRNSPTVAREKIIPFASNKSSFNDSSNDSANDSSNDNVIPRVIARINPPAVARENQIFANSHTPPTTFYPVQSFALQRVQQKAHNYVLPSAKLCFAKGTAESPFRVYKALLCLPFQGIGYKGVRSWGVPSGVYPHYPLFTERFSEEINALPYINKNSLFYSATHSPAVTKGTNRRADAALPFVQPHTLPQANVVGGSLVTQKNLKNNLLGVQNMCTSLLIQEPLNFNSWAVLNQWVFLIALLFWIEQTLLNYVFPALFALEQILLNAAGLRSGENNRTHILRISKNETPKFQNLAGIDGLLGELSELVLFLREQRNRGVAKVSFWNKWNKKNSYGVLLTGSPGTGKTFLVRALANEANVPVLILSASTLTANKLNNNKPSWSIRHAFKRAKQLAPCILFIDEIDALGKSRGKIVTDINEIVADTNLTSSSHKRILIKSTHNNSASLQQMFSYEQFGQNSSNFNATLFNKWEYPLQSTILQESNEINQNSLCQEKLVDLLKIVGGAPNYVRPLYPGGVRGMELRRNSFGVSSGKESAEESTSSDRDNKGTPYPELPTLEKEMTRGKFGPLTQLLVSMDGVSSFSGVLIMGATNRPELLDQALTRPGRFEKIIRINKPSEQNRIEILQLYSQNLGVQQQIPWSYLATRTIGLTTADLAVAMNYSSLRAIIQDSVHTLETIEYGLNCITRF